MKKLILALALACMAGAAQAYGIKVAINPFKISSGPLNGQMLGLVSGYSESPAVMSGAKVYFFTIPYSTTSPSTTDAPSAMLNFLRQCDDIKGLDLTKFSDAQSEYALSLTTDASGTYTTAATIIPHVPESDATTYAGCYLVAFSDANREYVYISPVTTKSVSASNSKKADTSTTSISFQPSKTALTNYKEASFQGGGWYSTASSTGPVVPSGPTEPWVEVDKQEITGAIDNKVAGKWSFTPQTSYNSVEICFPDGFTKQADTTVYLKFGKNRPLSINSLKLNGAKLVIQAIDGYTDLAPYLDIPAADANGFIDLTQVALKAGYVWGIDGKPAIPSVKIGENGYTSLTEAFIAAKDGDTITLTDDVTGAVDAIKISKNITIDLNTHVFDCNIAKQDLTFGGYAIGVAAGVTATIKNGTIKYTAPTACSASVQSAGILTVENVTLAAADMDGNPYSVKFAVLGDGKLQSESIVFSDSNCCTDAGGKVVFGKEQDDTVSIAQRINQIPYTLTLSAEKGTLKTTEVQVFVQHEGDEYTFKDGDIKVEITDLSKTGYELAGWAIDNGDGTFTPIVYGTTKITGNANLVAQYKPATYVLRYVIANVIYDPYTSTYVYGAETPLRATSDRPQGTPDYYAFAGWYRDSGFTDGPYTKVPADATGAQSFYAKFIYAEVKIDSKPYETFGEALAAAQPGATITFVRDGLVSSLVLDKNVTLDFGGKTFAGNISVTAGSVVLKNGKLTGALSIVDGEATVTKTDNCTLAAPDGYEWVNGVLTKISIVIEPAKEGDEQTVEIKAASKEEAEQKAAEAIQTPDEAVVSKAEYAAYFKTTATANGDGTFDVKVALDPAVVTPAIATEAAAGEEPVKVEAEKGETAVAAKVENVKPGLWYGYKVATELGGETDTFANDVGSFQQAKSNGSLTLKSTPQKGKAAFFKISVSPVQPKAE